MMFNEKPKTYIFCIGAIHWSATISIEIDVKNTCGIFKIGQGVQGNRSKSIIVWDDTVQAKRLGKFFKILEKKLLLTLEENQQPMFWRNPGEH